jgi:hypothetical protein
MNAKHFLLARRIGFLGIVLALTAASSFLLQSPRTALAAALNDGTPPASTSVVTPGVTPGTDSTSGAVINGTLHGGGFEIVNTIVFTIVKVVIGAMYLIMILAFIVGSVKNASFSMVAQKFGMANMMSTELMNLLGGLLLFLGGLATIPAVNWVIDQAASLINNIVISIPNINPSIIIK